MLYIELFSSTNWYFPHGAWFLSHGKFFCCEFLVTLSLILKVVCIFHGHNIVKAYSNFSFFSCQLLNSLFRKIEGKIVQVNKKWLTHTHFEIIQTAHRNSIMNKTQFLPFEFYMMFNSLYLSSQLRFTETNILIASSSQHNDWNLLGSQYYFA